MTSNDIKKKGHSQNSIIAVIYFNLNHHQHHNYSHHHHFHEAFLKLSKFVTGGQGSVLILKSPNPDAENHIRWNAQKERSHKMNNNKFRARTSTWRPYNGFQEDVILSVHQTYIFERSQLVLKKVKWTYFDAYLWQTMLHDIHPHHQPKDHYLPWGGG